MAQARIVLTGDELLRGFVQDANGPFLADALRKIGIELREIRVCGDEFEEIVATVRAMAETPGTDLVITSGGLGPTHDDRTAEAVAAVCGVPLALSDDALTMVEERIAWLNRGRDWDPRRFADGNRKQATVPLGATVLPPSGTAPGFVVEHPHGSMIAVLPGPPSELRHAWGQALESDPVRVVRGRVRATRERLLRIWGVPESYASVALQELGHVDDDGVRVTLCARDGELELSVRGPDVAGVDRLADALAARWPEERFALDDERDLAQIVGDRLAELGLTVGVAESCTGGLLGALLTEPAGASAWFVGGILSYSNAVKTERLGVPEALLEAHGAVSEETALAMAEGARTAVGADVGLAITGVAGPGGGTQDKPVGTVWLAVADADGARAWRIRSPGDRSAIRRRSAITVLHRLRQRLG